MKKLLFVLALGGFFGHSTTALAQAPPAETQALTKQLNQLMRNPQMPKQDVTLTVRKLRGEKQLTVGNYQSAVVRPAPLRSGERLLTADCSLFTADC